MLSRDPDIKPDSILLPTSYFPPVAYYAYLASGRQILIELHETYPKQTYRNRFEILTPAGRTSLTVPVTKPFGNHTSTSEIRICYREPWQRTHWRAMEAAYNSSPYFSFYAEHLYDLFCIREDSLINLNRNILEAVNRLIGISPVLSYSSGYEKVPDGKLDLRKALKPGKSLPNFTFPQYPQVFSHIHGFTSNLSILDLLFNLGPESREYLRLLANEIPN